MGFWLGRSPVARRTVAAVIGLMLITAAACGDDADTSPSSNDGNDTYDEVEEVEEPTQEELDAEWLAELHANVGKFLTGHVVTFPDGSTARCVVSSRDGDELECDF